MSYYTVVTPCVVGTLHYATIPAQPIEVDDALAAPLVASGSLMPYPIPSATVDDENRDPVPADGPADEPETPARSRRRRSQD